MQYSTCGMQLYICRTLLCILVIITEQPLLMLLVTPEPFLLWHIHMSAVRKVCELDPLGNDKETRALILPSYQD